MPTTWISTRPGAERYTFREAVVSGWAQNGGMLMPDPMPSPVSAETMAAWAKLSYPELAVAVLSRFADDPADAALVASAAEAFVLFGHDDVVTMRDLPGDAAAAVAELWHGPTLAFKDLGMSVLMRFLGRILEDKGGDDDRLTLLVGTSGDTGPAALEAVRAVASPRLDCIVLYPIGRVSVVQEAQMVVADREAASCVVAGCEGTSDDLDRPCAAVMNDSAFRAAHKLGTVNSVNVVRMTVQIVHYFWAYFRATAGHWAAAADGSAAPAAAAAPEVVFSVPTGAAGHMIAGLLAARLGLPARTVIAQNANDTMVRCIRDGVLQLPAEVAATKSNAMDIAAPYNVERILHALLLKDSGASSADPRVEEVMRVFNAGGAAAVPPEAVAELQRLYAPYTVTDAAVAATVREVAAAGYTIDPHTAVGVSALRRYRADVASDAATPAVCMGCAHPAKFAEVVGDALGKDAAEAVPDPEHRNVKQAMKLRAESLASGVFAQGLPVFRDGADWEAQLRGLVEGVTERRAKERKS